MTVLEEDGVVSGLLQPKDAEINGLWVHPAQQGRGAGLLLLRAGEALIQAAGHSLAWLTCSAWNERALQFYRRAGYGETARHRAPHASGVELEEVRMERALGSRGLT